MIFFTINNPKNTKNGWVLCKFYIFFKSNKIKIKLEIRDHEMSPSSEKCKGHMSTDN